MKVWVLKHYDKDTLDSTVVGIFDTEQQALRCRNMYPDEVISIKYYILNDFDQDFIDQMRNTRK